MQEEKTEGRGRRKRKLSSQRVPAVKESGTVVQTIRIQSVHVRDMRSLILSHHFTHINVLTVHGFTQRPPSMRLTAFEMIAVMTEILCLCFCDSSGDEGDEKERKEKPPVEV